MASDESRIFLWGGAAVSGSGLIWVIPGINAIGSIIAIAALVLIVSRLGYMRAIWAAFGGIVLTAAMSYLTGSMLFGGLEPGVTRSSLILSTLMNVTMFTAVVLAPGIAMGAASRALATAMKTIVFGCIPLIALLGILATFYVGLLRSTPAVIAIVNNSIEMTIDQNPGLAKMLSDESGDDASKEKIIEAMDKIVIVFIRLIPGTIAVGFMAIVIFSLSLAGRIGARLRLMIPRLRPFYHWHASEWWLLPTAVGLALLIFGGNDLWKFAGGNILVVAANVYILTGLAVIESYFIRLSIPMPLRIAFYLIIFIMSFTFVSLIFLAILGLIDSRFNFKRENSDREDMDEA